MPMVWFFVLAGICSQTSGPAAGIRAAPAPGASNKKEDAGPSKADRALVEAEEWLSRGQIAFAQKDYRKAAGMLDTALKLRSGWTVARYWRGMARALLGQHKKAEEDLQAAAYEITNDQNLLLTLGRVQLAQGKYMWAMRQLQAVLEMDRSNNEARLELSYCLMRLEEYDDAIKQLRVLLKSNPKAETGRRGRVLLGICLYRKQKLDQAREVLGRAGGTRSMDDWGRGSREMLEILLGRQFGAEKGWGFSITVGGGVDTNPAMNEEGLAGWSRTKDTALDAFLTGRAWWTPLVRGRHSITGELGIQRHFYVAAWNDETQDRVSAFNMTVISAGGLYRYDYLSRSKHRSLSIGYTFQLNQLDGGKGIPSEPDAFLFSEKHGGLVSWLWRHDPKHTTELQVRPWWMTFRDKDRDGFGAKVSVRHSAFLMNNRFKLFPEVFGGYQHTRWEAWRHLSLGGWTGLSYLMPFSLDLTGSLSYELRYYDGSAEAFEGISPNSWLLPQGKDRLDQILSIGAGIGRTLDKKKRWRVDLSLRYSYNWSRAELYSYGRFTALLGVTASMERISGGRAR